MGRSLFQEVRRASTVVAIAFVAAVGVAALAVGFDFGTEGALSNVRPSAVPGQLDFTAEAISLDGSTYVAIVSEAPRAGASLRVHVSDDQSQHFSSLPPISEEVIEGGWRVSTAAFAGQACVAFTPVEKASAVRCYNPANKAWSSLPSVPSAAGWRVIDMKAHRGGLIALQSKLSNGSRTRFRLIKYVRGEWQVEGPVISAASGVALLNHSTRGDSNPELTLVEGNGRKATRAVLGLRRGRWIRLNPPIQNSFGSLLTGSVHRGPNSWDVPAMRTRPTSKPWRFMIFRASPKKNKMLAPGKLNRSAGNAQGGVWATSSNEVWTAWVEDPFSERQKTSSIYAQRVGSRGLLGKPVRVWSGPSLGVGALSVYGDASGVHVVYGVARSAPDGGVRTVSRRIAPSVLAPVAIDD